MWSRGVLGFDGMFENVGVAVEPNSVDSIKDGINSLIEKNDEYRNTILSLQNKGGFKIFGADYVREKYYEAISEIIGH